MHSLNWSEAANPLPRNLTRTPGHAPDRRADGQERAVSFSREVVRIDRKVRGVAMRVAVPVAAYSGVALTLTPGRDGGLNYELKLIHRDEDLSIALEQAGDDSEILADWRLWSQYFGLPALVERQPGTMEPAEPSLGALHLGWRANDRRSGRLVGKRRPRFLKRRKAGVVSSQPTIHAEEREIIART